MPILITICARGGSKGIPGKNIKVLNGKPLIYYTIDTAQQFQNCYYEGTDIVLSTDSDEIRQAVERYGLSTDYIRPQELAGDLVGKIDVITDVLQYYEEKGKKYDYVLDMDVTSPLRNLDDLITAFELLKKNEDALNLFSVSPSSRNPYFNMVEQKNNGFYSLVKKLDQTVLTRQSAPVVYDLNASFYFYKRVFFQEKYRGAITEKSLAYVIPHICFDLDHPIDFEFLSYLLANDKLDFSL